MSIEIWADGSSSGKSNLPGGWAFVILRDDVPLLADYGGHPSTTNNAMEALGALRGIQAWARMADQVRKPGETVTLVSDSQITLGLATGQYNANKNVELAGELRRAYQLWCSGIRWVRGHCGTLPNEWCDRLAKRGRQEQLALLSSHDSKAGTASGQRTKDSRQV